MGKWFWKRKWNYSALDSPAKSVSRRVVKLAIPSYFSGHCHPKREAMGTKSKS